MLLAQGDDVPIVMISNINVVANTYLMLSFLSLCDAIRRRHLFLFERPLFSDEDSLVLFPLDSPCINCGWCNS